MIDIESIDLDKYKDKFKYQSDIICDDVYRYLKEKGEI